VKTTIIRASRTQQRQGFQGSVISKSMRSTKLGRRIGIHHASRRGSDGVPKVTYRYDHSRPCRDRQRARAGIRKQFQYGDECHASTMLFDIGSAVSAVAVSDFSLRVASPWIDEEVVRTLPSGGSTGHPLCGVSRRQHREQQAIEPTTRWRLRPAPRSPRDNLDNVTSFNLRRLRPSVSGCKRS